MSASKSGYLIFEELGEELLFIIWSVWQYLRIIMLIKNQRKAKQDAADIIEFSQVDEDNVHAFSKNNNYELHLEDKPHK
mgnify:CR=1 FL=1